MQIFGISSAAWNAQLLNPLLLSKPVKPTVQAAQSTTILLEASSQSDRSAHVQNAFMYMALPSGGILIIEEMMFSSSFSATADGIHASSSFVESSGVFASSGADFSYASATTSSFSTSESNLNYRFNALA